MRKRRAENGRADGPRHAAKAGRAPPALPGFAACTPLRPAARRFGASARQKRAAFFLLLPENMV